MIALLSAGIVIGYIDRSNLEDKEEAGQAIRKLAKPKALTKERGYDSTLENHLWQSGLFSCAVALMMLMLRRNRATVRHRLWLALRSTGSIAVVLQIQVLARAARVCPV